MEDPSVQQTESSVPLRTKSEKNIRLNLHIILCAIIGIGSHLSWSATGIAYFIGINEIMNIAQLSLMTSLLPLGAVLGTLPVGILADKYGRKYVCVCSILPMLISWFIIFFVQTAAGVYVGRFLAGLGCGATSIAIPLYFSEICFKETHQQVVNKIQAFLNIGIFWSYFVCLIIYKNHVQFEGPKILFTGLGSLLALFILVLPESPMWLKNRGRNEEAEVALRKITANYLAVDGPEPGKVIGNCGLRLSVLRTINNRNDMKMIMCLVVLQIISGIGAFTFFLTHYIYYIIQNDSPTIIYCVILVVPILTSFLNEKFHRCMGEKHLLILSTCLMAISAFSLAAFSYGVQPWDSEKEVFLYTILVILTAIYLSAFQIGLGPVPWIMIGKMLPPSKRKMVYNLAATYTWTTLFVSTLGYINLMYSVELHFLFLIYGLINLVAMCVAIFCVPTRVEEIREDIVT